MEDKPTDNGRLPLLPLLISIYLIGTFLWRAFAAAHELPSITLRNLTVGLDLACLVALIGLWTKAAREKPSPLGPGLHVLFLFGVLAGLGMFGIRLSGSTESWWTGHIKYELTPRSDSHENKVVDIHGNAVVPAGNVPNDTTPATPGSPSAAYKAFFVAYNNKDIDTLKTLISKTIFAFVYSTNDRKKADEIVDERLRKMLENKVRPSDATRNEKITADTATVECISPKGNWYTAEFVKEDGQWKLKTF